MCIRDSSHRLDEAIQYADTAVVLRNGELVSQCDMELSLIHISALILMKEGKAVATSVGVKPQAAIEQMIGL